MKTLIEQLAAENRRKSKKLLEIALSQEHQVYSRIPGTSNAYRRDSANTNTQALRRAHVYAKQNGGKKKLYSVSLDEGGIENSDGLQIPREHADFFRGNGYNIRLDNVLESVVIDRLIDNSKYSILLLNDAIVNV